MGCIVALETTLLGAVLVMTASSSDFITGLGEGFGEAAGLGAADIGEAAGLGAADDIGEAVGLGAAAGFAGVIGLGAAAGLGAGAAGLEASSSPGRLIVLDF